MHSYTTSILCLLSLAALTISSVSAVIIQPNSPKVSPIIGQESDWLLVGQMGRKTFYRNNNVTNSAVTDWFGARDRCQVAGLRFADFQSREEFSFVREQMMNAGIYYGQWWVSGKMKGMEEFTERQNFVWGDGSNIPEMNFLMLSQHFVCLTFSADDHLYTDACYYGRHGTLCQFVL